ARARSRRILAERIAAGDRSAHAPFLARRWRWAPGACLAPGCATKSTGGCYTAAFGLRVELWAYGARRAKGVRTTFSGATRLAAGAGFVQLVVVGVVTEVATWWGCIFKPGGWGRGEVAGFVLWRPFEALPDLWRYHAQIFGFHSGLDDEHPYQSWPWDW